MNSPLPDAQFSRFSSGDLAFAASGWRMKANQEYLSAGVFAELAAALLDCGNSPAVGRAFNAIVADELEHVALCDGLSRELGNRDDRARHDSIRTRLAHHAGDRRLEALSLLMIEGAVGETLSTALFSVSAARSEEPRTRACLAQIQHDETRHARVCWEVLKNLLVPISDEHRSRLQADLAVAFASLERQMAQPILQRLERGEAVSAERVALGIIPLQERVDVFYRTIENTITSKLSELALDPARAWKDRFLHSAGRP